MADSTHTSASWRQASRQEGLKQYLQTIRDRWWVVLLAILLTTGAAAAYVATAEKVYEAEADVLVSPVPEEAELLISLGLIASSGDPLRDIETASRLISSIEIAELASEELAGTPAEGMSPDELLDAVSALPLAESNIVSLTARSGDPEAAAVIANSFARAAIAQRTDAFQERLQLKLKELEEAASSADPADLATQPIFDDIAQLRLLQDQQDPTLSLQVAARPPDSAVSPRPLLSIIGGVLAGLVLGLGAAFAMRVLDPRLRREEQLTENFRLPILTRVPRDPGGGRGHMPIAPEKLSPATMESYRTLRGTLGVFRPPGGAGGGRSILVTSASAKEGKSTTALGLGTAMAQAGNRVIMIEADLRRPELGSTLGLGVKRGVVSVLIGESSLEDALVTSPHLPGLRMLLADHTGPATSEFFALPVAAKLIEAAASMADFVIVDSAPMGEVIDSLPLARVVDDVLVCVRLNEARLQEVSRLAELLEESGVKPSGFAIIGTKPPTSDYYFKRETPPHSSST